jgi:hypothetical protein
MKHLPVEKKFSLFVLFLLAIVLSVLLRYTDYDYPFGIFKLFLKRSFKPIFRITDQRRYKYVPLGKHR